MSVSKPLPVRLIGLLCLAVLSSGCQMLHSAKLAQMPSATPEHPVVEIVCLWEPGEGTDLSGLPCRGFAGQLMFFAMGETAPVRVDGKVRIYVFDDQGTPEEQQQPIHQFDFDSKAFQSFLTQTNIGAAYQLFIPYTRKGAHRAACTLRVRFSPEEGNRVYSKMGTVILPGTTPRKPDEPIGETAAAKPVSPPISQTANLRATAAELLSEMEPKRTATAIPAGETAAESDATQKRLLRSKLTEIANISPTSRSDSMQEAGSSEPHRINSDFQTQPQNAVDEGATSSHQKLRPFAPADSEVVGNPVNTPEISRSPARHPLLDDTP